MNNLIDVCCSLDHNVMVIVTMLSDECDDKIKEAADFVG
jgi:hypothetical protein